ncbi:amino acid deaminase/aldolase [Paenibacillus albicereus]|uniref:Amino acid deaminase/aldolase n=1 Tax=Paenibacillus albicereus TaxID=2726185 RepID=A0A6H2GUJ1_9BACL|nr:amino acid deaminase/aldolase [Paenibacillus albicereus]QJC51080.1 amino acid deaminase/aldolase [Paenibacillus albicereus]
MSDYETYRKAFEGRPAPFAYVDLDRLDANAAAMVRSAGGKRIRIASKSIRSPAIMRRILASDPAYQGIMCFTAAEAAFLAEQGFDDLLLGYPQTDERPIRELLGWIAAGRSIVFMADDEEHLRLLERLARELGLERPVPVCLDLDLSVSYPGLHFGVKRSPLRGWRDVRPLAERILGSPALELAGLMGYEAQVAGVGDDVPGQPLQNALIRLLQKRSIAEAARRRAEAVAGLRSLGAPPRLVNAGGTGSLSTSSREADVTELTAGSGFYSPALFDRYRRFRLEPAAGFAVPVARLPERAVATCLGGGYVGSGAAGKDRLPVPYLPPGLRLLPLEGAGEVQTPLRLPPGTELAIGDPVFFRHAKAGELCERFDRLLAVSGGRVVDEYPTYRGMGACFL